MRLCTVQAGESEPFFGILLTNKILRIRAAAAAFRFRPAQLAHLRDMMSYLGGLPNSEKLLRRLLQEIADDPHRVAGNADDGLPFLYDSTAITYLPPVPKPEKVLCI